MQILTSHPGKAPQPVHLLHWVLQSLSLQPDQPHTKDPLMGTWPDQGLWRLSSPFCTQPLNPFEPAKCKSGTKTSVFRKFVGVFQLQRIPQGLLQRLFFTISFAQIHMKTKDSNLLDKIQARPCDFRAGNAFRPWQCVQNGQTHVRPPKLGKHGWILLVCSAPIQVNRPQQ